MSKTAKTESIAKNYVLNTLLQVFRLLIPLVTAPYISRVFEPDGIGIRSFTTSIAGVFIIFAVMGTNTYGQQTIAQCRDSKSERSNKFWGIFFVCLTTTILTTIFWLILAIVYQKYTIYLLVLTIQIIAAALDISWYFAALERFNEVVYRNIAIKLVIVILLFVFIRSKDDLLLYMMFESLGMLLCNLSMWLPLAKSVGRTKITIEELKYHLRQTLAYFLPAIAASVYTYIDKAMIGFLTDSKYENGYYEQAQSIVNMSYTLVSSLNIVMASRNAYLFAKNRIDEVKDKLFISLVFVLTISFPLTFGIIGVADNFVPWFFGPGYDSVVALLKMESPLVILLSIHNYLTAQYLIPSGQRSRSNKGVIIGAIVNLMLNAVLIPHFQAMGAVIATLLAELTMCSVYAYMSKEFIPVTTMLRESLKPMFASFIMFITIASIDMVMDGGIATTIVQIATGVTIYLIAILLLKNEFSEYIIRRYSNRRRISGNSKENNE